MTSVLLVTQVFPPRNGGSGRWLWELYRRVADMAIHVIAGRAEGDREFDRTAPLVITRTDLDFPSWGLMHPGGARSYVRTLAELRRLVARDRIDVLHCGKCLPEGLLALGVRLLRGTPFIVYAHGEELMLARTSRELRFLTGRVLRAARTVIANSHHTRQLLIADWRVPADRLVVMHPGVDTRTFAPAVADPEVRRRLGWDERRVVLTVGTLQKRKGQDMMIRALPMIRARCPDVLYSLIGNGRERDYLEALVDEYGVRDLVQFRGAPADGELVECYQQCDLFALPNRQVGWDLEGFGIVLIEAQACGKPVIAGASGGAPETVRPGITGEVLSGDSPETLGHMVAALLDDPRRRLTMGAEARRWAERFDWNVLCRQAQVIFAGSRSR